MQWLILCKETEEVKAEENTCIYGKKKESNVSSAIAIRWIRVLFSKKKKKWNEMKFIIMLVRR